MMATPTLSLAQLSSPPATTTTKPSPKSKSLLPDNNENVTSNIFDTTLERNGKSNEIKPSATDSRYRRQVTEEINDDSIYSIYLKKITYTFNNTLKPNNSKFVTRCDQVDYRSTDKEYKSNTKWYDDQQVGAHDGCVQCPGTDASPKRHSTQHTINS